MSKKLYISPEFEWMGFQLVDDVLTASNPYYPDINTDDNDIEDGLFDDPVQDESHPDINFDHIDLDDLF